MAWSIVDCDWKASLTKSSSSQIGHTEVSTTKQSQDQSSWNGEQRSWPKFFLESTSKLRYYCILILSQQRERVGKRGVKGNISVCRGRSGVCGLLKICQGFQKQKEGRTPTTNNTRVTILPKEIQTVLFSINSARLKFRMSVLALSFLKFSFIHLDKSSHFSQL